MSENPSGASVWCTTAGDPSAGVAVSFAGAVVEAGEGGRLYLQSLDEVTALRDELSAFIERQVAGE